MREKMTMARSSILNDSPPGYLSHDDEVTDE